MTASWLETVAKKAGMSPAEAETELRRRGITPDRQMRPVRSLTITSIAFKGEKGGKAQGAIDFFWEGLKPGVWAITSEKNFAGKSSIIEIILWCLRGTPKDLQSDVRKWLSWVALDFVVDAQPYRIEFTVETGIPTGTLILLRPGGGQRLSIASLRTKALRRPCRDS